MNYFSPAPKTKRLKLTKTKWDRLVDELYKREHGHCEICKRWLFRNEANPHHVISKGAGGDDKLENLKLLCLECHNANHRGSE